MKKRIQKIIFPALLITNLLFGQLAVNFLHNPHNEHEPDVKTQSDKASVHRHGDHCKVCSLETFFNLFSETPARVDVQPEENSLVAFEVVNTTLSRISTAQGRAPPFLS